MELIDKIKEDLKNTLSERRYIHSLGVMEMAVELAKIYNVDDANPYPFNKLVRETNIRNGTTIVFM